MILQYEDLTSLIVVFWLGFLVMGYQLIPKYYPRVTTGKTWSYIQLLRPLYHLNFLFVTMGVLYLEQPLKGSIISELALFYLSFNIFLYGGIYTFNAWIDREQDAEHPEKRNRPIASGEIGATK